MESLENEKVNLRQKRATTFLDMIARKFGTARGYKSAAGQTLGIQPANFYSMITGRINIPDKYFAALEALPDKRETVGYEIGGQWSIKLYMSHEQYAKIEACSYFHLHNPQSTDDFFEIDGKGFSRLVELMADKYLEHLKDAYPGRWWQYKDALERRQLSKPDDLSDSVLKSKFKAIEAEETIDEPDPLS